MFLTPPKPLRSLILLGSLLVVGSIEVSAARSADAPLTAEQKERLKERDRLWEEMKKLRAEGKLAEAIPAVAKMLAIDREVFGNVHEDVAGALRQLAELHQQREDLAAAREARIEILGIETKLHGQAHYRVTDARLDLAYVDQFGKLGKADREKLVEAQRLLDTFFELNGKKQFREALPLIEKALMLRREVLGQKHKLSSQAAIWCGWVNMKLGNLDQAEPLLRQSVAVRKEILGDKHPDYAGALFTLASLYKQRKEYDKAEPLVLQELQIRKEVLGVNDSEFLMGLHNLAVMYESMGQYPKAVAACRELLAVRKEINGDKHPDYLRTLGDLAYLLGQTAEQLEQQEDFASARKARQEVVTIQTTLFGEKDWRVTDARLALAHGNQLAKLDAKQRQRLREADQLLQKVRRLDAAKNYKEALAPAEQALEIRTEVLGKQHPLTGYCLSWLGSLHYDLKEYGEADKFYRQTLEIRQKVLGPNHPDCAFTLADLGATAHAQRNYAQAVDYRRQAVAIRRLTLGEQDGRTLNGMRNLVSSLDQLAAVQEARDEFAAARNSRQEVVTIQTTLHGEQHWRVTDARLALALAEQLAKLDAKQRLRLREADQLLQKVRQLDEAKNYKQALAPAELALEIRQELLGEQHPLTGHCLSWLGSLHFSLKEYAEADKLHRQTLEIRRKALGPNHPDCAFTLYDLGSAAYVQGNYAQAVEYNRQALAIRRAALGEQDDRTLNSMRGLAASLNDLGFTLQKQGAYAEALPHLAEALEMRRKLYPLENYPHGHPHLVLSLTNLGELFKHQGEYTKALPLLEQSLEMCRKLYPPDKYPSGDPQFAVSLAHLASALADQGEYRRALAYYQQALEMDKKLYPSDKYPQGHPDLARALGNMGFVLSEQREYSKALYYSQQALEMKQKLYPLDKYPRGHTGLAAELNNLGYLLNNQGEFGKSLTYYQQALQMRRKLFPLDKYPQGHPDLALALHNVGASLRSQGKLAEARVYLVETLKMRQTLYPLDKYPRGHPDLAGTLGTLGLVLKEQREYDQALAYYQQALESYQKLYPADKYPQGQPQLATSLHNLGRLLQAQGKYREALPYLQQALEMRQKLYPAKWYPQGHDDIAISLEHNSFLLNRLGERQQAFRLAEEALVMRQGLFDVFAARASEAEIMNFAADNSWAEEVLLWITQDTNLSADTVYARLWRSKGVTSRLLQHRQQALATGGDPETQKLAQELQDTRRALARWLLAPADGKESTRQQIVKLTQTKEDLERKLAARLPAFKHQQELDRQGPDQLVKLLPERTAFVDLFRYTDYHFDKPGLDERTLIPRYVAFLLVAGQPIRRIELGPAAPIETALKNWRQAIVDRKVASDDAAKLGQLVWEPLRKQLPHDTRLVWLAADAALNQLPWAALPGARPGTVLLEDQALAAVLHGPYLLDRLTAPAEPASPGNEMLILGGVDYDGDPAPVGKPDGELATLRGPALAKNSLAWMRLPGTGVEKAKVEALARAAGDVALLSRTGADASTRQLLLDLPRVRMAHLATHGFFADTKFRSVLQVDEKQFERSGKDRAAPGARNPLVLSGLVLAGANRASEESDRGILTAEAISGLPLLNLDLAVLSACETGLGETAGGEGVFGLQRAFHLAGTRTVVASLWSVDDAATQKLMTRFYENLWQKKLPKLEALRQAQLSVLYDLPESSLPRGAEVVRENAADVSAVRADPRLWAAWVLSGDPGDPSQIAPVAAAPAVATPIEEAGSASLYPSALAVAGVLLAGVAALVWWRRRTPGQGAAL